MTTPHTPNHSTTAGRPAPSPRIAPHQSDQPDDAAENAPAAPPRAAFGPSVSFCIIIIALAGIGLMIVAAGSLVFEDTAAAIPMRVGGAILVIIASSIGLVAGVFTIVAVSRELFKGGRKTA